MHPNITAAITRMVKKINLRLIMPHPRPFLMFYWLHLAVPFPGLSYLQFAVLQGTFCLVFATRDIGAVALAGLHRPRRCPVLSCKLIISQVTGCNQNENPLDEARGFPRKDKEEMVRFTVKSTPHKESRDLHVAIHHHP